MILGLRQIVIHHLTRLSFLDLPVLVFAHGLHEGLVDELPHRPPSGSVLHHQDMISPRHQIRNEGLRPVAIERAFLVQEILDILPVADHERGILEPFQGKNAPVLLSPSGHAGPAPSAWHQNSDKLASRTENGHRLWGSDARCPAMAP